jgi:hypothetical protein
MALKKSKKVILKGAGLEAKEKIQRKKHILKEIILIKKIKNIIIILKSLLEVKGKKEKNL